MRIRYLAAVVLTAAVAAIPAEAQPRVAILGSPGVPSWNNDVRNKIFGTGLFSTVDVFNVQSTLPTLAQLGTYEAVLAYTDAIPAAGFGNLLADYFDGGGRVVTATFGTVSGIDIGGRWRTGGYSLLTFGGQGQGTPLTMVPVIPDSPLLQGVNSFNGGALSFHSTGTPVAGATVVANWSNGRPLVVTGTVGGRQRVDLNFFPVSSDVRAGHWVSSTGGGRLMANALLFGGPTQVIPEPSTYALLATGLGAVGLVARRRRQQEAGQA